MIAVSQSRSSEYLLWTHTENTNDEILVVVLLRSKLFRMPSADMSVHTDDKGASSFKQGYFSDGSKYVKYLPVLYCNGFEKHKFLSNSNSVHGCYLLPLNLSVDSRRSVASTFVHSLVQYVCSQTQLLSSIVEDIVLSMTHGINGYGATGQAILIFLYAI